MRNRLASLVLCAALTALMPAPAVAGTIVTTDEAYFRSRLLPGYATEDFEQDPRYSSGGHIGYQVDSYGIGFGAVPYGVLVGGTTADSWVSTAEAGKTMIIQISSGSPLAVGGNFFLSDRYATTSTLPDVNIRVGVDDGTFVDMSTKASVDGRSFIGFLSDSPISMLMVVVRAGQSSGPDRYATVNNMILGTPIPTSSTGPTAPGRAVPEPSSLASISLGGLAGVAFLRRRSRRARA